MPTIQGLITSDISTKWFKGFNLLKSLDKSLIPSISSIIYDIDKKLEMTSEEILDLSLKLGIKAKPWDKSLVTSLKVELVSKDIYCIAIGWKVN